MGGGVRHDEGVKAFHFVRAVLTKALRGSLTVARRFARTLGIFSLGHEIIDSLLDDAQNAHWCAANAWRRPATNEIKRWDGMQVAFELSLGLSALAEDSAPRRPASYL